MTSSDPSNHPAGTDIRARVMTRVEQAAEEIGVAIAFSSRLPEGWLGAYCRDTNVILLRPGMDMATFRSVVAHELGHAYYRHEHTTDREANWRHEMLADAYAARLLIDEDAYRRCTLHGLIGDALAKALTVLPWVIQVFPGGTADHVA